MDLQKIEDLITPALKENNYLIVDLIAFQNAGRKILDVRLEKDDFSPFSLEDCRKANRLISTILDVEDFIIEKYVLEVGSAGINRPLKTREHFKRFIGNNIKLETVNLVDNRRRFKGKLLNSDNEITVETEDGVFKIEFENVEKAKLNNELENKKR